LVGIFTKVTFEKHIYTYYTTARYIADKPWQTLSFTSLALPPLAKNIILSDFRTRGSYSFKREKNGKLTNLIEKSWESSYNWVNVFGFKELAKGEFCQ